MSRLGFWTRRRRTSEIAAGGMGIVYEAEVAVHRAHQYGVMHRDLKPTNIHLDEDVSPWLTSRSSLTSLVLWANSED